MMLLGRKRILVGRGAVVAVRGRHGQGRGGQGWRAAARRGQGREERGFMIPRGAYENDVPIVKGTPKTVVQYSTGRAFTSTSRSHGTRTERCYNEDDFIPYPKPNRLESCYKKEERKTMEKMVRTLSSPCARVHASHSRRRRPSASKGRPEPLRNARSSIFVPSLDRQCFPSSLPGDAPAGSRSASLPLFIRSPDTVSSWRLS